MLKSNNFNLFCIYGNLKFPKDASLSYSWTSCLSFAVKSKYVKQLFRINHSLPPHTASGYQKLCSYRQKKSAILVWVFSRIFLPETGYCCYFWLLLNSQGVKHRRINNLLRILRPLDNKNYNDSEQSLSSTWLQVINSHQLMCTSQQDWKICPLLSSKVLARKISLKLSWE